MRIAILLTMAGLTSFADTVNYSHDDAGRLIKVDYGNGQSISYTYDKAGNLLSRQVGSATQQSSARKRVQHNKSAPKPAASRTQ
jgi:YD repeat-containing protein